MESHEYANLFPMMSTADIQALADDIKANGQQQPITSYDSKILDGRNRFAACKIAGVDPQIIAYGGKDPLGYVISHNLNRRHLRESQRGIVAEKLSTMKNGGNNKSTSSIDGVPIGREKAAAMLNVGTATVDRARSVMKKGAAELVAVVESGEVSVSAAAEVAKLPEEEQREIVSQGAEAIKDKAKEIREYGSKPAAEYSVPTPRKPSTPTAKEIAKEIRALIGKMPTDDPGFLDAVEQIKEWLNERVEAAG